MYDLAKFPGYIAVILAFGLLTGCVTAPVAQPVKKIGFPKYGFVIDEPSWNTLLCNQKFMLSADESKAMENTNVKYDRGYLFICNSAERSSKNGPDVRIGWRDTRFPLSSILNGVISEIGNSYHGAGTNFTYQCKRIDEVLNPLFISKAWVCRVNRDSEKIVRYDVAVYTFSTESHQHTENWVMVVDAYNQGVATETWLKKVVETIRPLPR